VAYACELLDHPNSALLYTTRLRDQFESVWSYVFDWLPTLNSLQIVDQLATSIAFYLYFAMEGFPEIADELTTRALIYI
jgi:hypothetical protein